MKNQIDQSTPFLAFYDLLRIRGIYSDEEKREKLRRGFRRAMALAATLVALALPQSAWARPRMSGPLPVGVSLSADEKTMTISSGSSFTWDAGFNIAGDEKVDITAGNTVHRDTSGNGSSIAGTLDAHGASFWILNPKGISVSTGAHIDNVSGFLAAAMDGFSWGKSYGVGSDVVKGNVDLGNKTGSSYTVAIGQSVDGASGATVVATKGMVAGSTFSIAAEGGTITFAGDVGSGVLKAGTIHFENGSNVGVEGGGDTDGSVIASGGTINVINAGSTVYDDDGNLTSFTQNDTAKLTQKSGTIDAATKIAGALAQTAGKTTTATVTGDATVAGTLNGVGGLNVGGALESSGTIIGNGAISVTGEAKQTAGSINAGANDLELSAGGTFAGTVTAGSISAAGQTVNQTGGSITLQNGAGALSAATFTQSGAGQTRAGAVNAAVDQSDAATLNAASISAGATQNGTGSITLSGALSGGVTQSAGNTGTITAATVNDGVTQDGGTITAPTVNGAVVQSAGTINASTFGGTVEQSGADAKIASTGNISFSGKLTQSDADASVSANGGNGTVTLENGGDLAGDVGARTIVQEGGVISGVKNDRIDAAFVQNGGEATVGAFGSTVNQAAGGTITTKEIVGAATIAGTLNGDGGLSVGSLSQSDGEINAHGSLTINGAAGQTGGSIAAGGLVLNSGTSNVTLDQDGNAFASVSGTAGAVKLKDVGETIGLGELTANSLTLESQGKVSQTGATTLRNAGAAAITATGDVVLDNDGNDFGTVNVTGENVQVKDKNALTVSGISATGFATVQAVDNVTVSGAVSSGEEGNVLVQSTGGSLTIEQAVTAGKNLSLLSSKNLVQNAAIEAKDGTIDIESSGGDVSVNANTTSTGATRFLANGGNGKINVSNGAAISADAVEFAGQVNGTVNNLSAESLGLSGGNITLNNLNVEKLAIQATGNVVVNNTSDALTIDEVKPNSVNVKRIKFDGTADDAPATGVTDPISGVTTTDGYIQIHNAGTVKVAEGKSVQATGNVTIQSDKDSDTPIENLGTIAAGTGTDGTIALNGGAAALGTITAGAETRVTIQTGVADLKVDETLPAAGSYDLRANNDVTVSSAVTATAGNLAIVAGHDANIDAGLVANAGLVSVDAGNDVTASTDLSTGGQGILLAAGNGGTLSANGVTATAGNVTLSGGTIDAAGAVNAAEGAVSATASAGATFGDAVTAGTAATLAAGNGALTTQEVTANGGNATLTGGSVTTGGAVTANAGNAVLRATDGAVTVNGEVNARNVAFEATGGVNENQKANATVAKTVHATGGDITLAADGGGFTAPTAVYRAENGTVTLNGDISGTQNLGVQGTMIANNANITGVNNLAIRTTSADPVQYTETTIPTGVPNLGIAAAGNLTVDVPGALTANGANVQANAGAGNVQVQAGGIESSGGTVEVAAGGDIAAANITGAAGTTVTAENGGAINVAGNLGQGGDTVVNANGAAVTAGTLASGDLLDVNNAGAVNANIAAGGAAQIQAASLQAGNTAAGGNLTFDTVTGPANVGNLAVGGDVNGTVNGLFTTAGGQVGSIGQQGGFNAPGGATVDGNLNSGPVLATTGAFTVNGALNAGGNAVVLNTAATTLNGGLTGGNVTINAGGPVTGGGALAAGQLNIAAGGNAITLPNVQSANLNNITGGNITLTDTTGQRITIGTINAGGVLDLTLNSAAGTVGGGNLTANGTMTLTVNGPFGDITAPVNITINGGNPVLNIDGSGIDGSLLHFILNGELNPGDILVNYLGEGFAIYGSQQAGWQIIGIGPEKQRLLNRALAFSVNTPELKSKQGIFGDPAMLHTRMNVSEARPGANMDMLALKSVDFSETWKDVSEAGGDLAEWTPAVYVDEAPLLPKLEALASEVQLQPEIQPYHGSTGNADAKE